MRQAGRLHRQHQLCLGQDLRRRIVLQPQRVRGRDVLRGREREQGAGSVAEREGCAEADMGECDDWGVGGLGGGVLRAVLGVREKVLIWTLRWGFFQVICQTSSWAQH